MQLVWGIETLKYQGELFISLGNFDGVHLGHQEIIRTTVQEAREKHGKSAVLIFNPHPMQILYPERSLALLHTFEDRIRTIGESGIDYCIVQPFTREFALMPPESFARDILKDRLKVRGVVVGFNYSFGYKGMSKAQDLLDLGKILDFSVKIVNPIVKNDLTVCSTRIRTLLAMGRVEEAKEMLGRPFSLRGPVVHGDGRGWQLGYPTANVLVSSEVIQPGDGVYLTPVHIFGEGEKGASFAYWALTNIGKRPTFFKTDSSFEVHLLDVKKNLYGKELNVQFLQKIREEMAFSGSLELVEQIKRDVLRARRVIKRRYSGIKY